MLLSIVATGFTAVGVVIVILVELLGVSPLVITTTFSPVTQVTLPFRVEPQPVSVLHSAATHKTDRIIKLIRSQYGVEVHTTEPEKLLQQYNVSVLEYSTAEKAQYLEQLLVWLQKYSPEYIRSIKLQSIYLFKEWRSYENTVGGAFLGPGVLGTSANEITFHHELFHIADDTDGGLTNDNWDWSRQKYGEVYQPAFAEPLQLQELLRLHESASSISPGFISVYGSHAGIDEDQATIAGAMMADYNNVRQLAQDDPKLQRSIEFLQEFMYAVSDGQMDALYWRDLRGEMQFSQEYWNGRVTDEAFMLIPEFERARKHYNIIEHARNVYESGDTEAAEQMYTEVIADQPKYTKYVRELAQIYESHRKYTKAIAVYLEAMKTQSDTHFDVRIARNYQALNQPCTAIVHYNEAYNDNYLTTVDMTQYELSYRLCIQDALQEGDQSKAFRLHQAMRRLFN